MQTFSPHLPGTVETRKSIGLPSIVTLMRPSCGSRFSAMSSLLRILKREITPSCTRLGSFWTTWSTPSIRKRTVTSLSMGSTWMSLAPCLMARPRIEFTRRMIGASSDALIRSCLVSAATSPVSASSCNSRIRSACSRSTVDASTCRAAPGGRGAAPGAGRGGVTSDLATSCG